MIQIIRNFVVACVLWIQNIEVKKKRSEFQKESVGSDVHHLMIQKNNKGKSKGRLHLVLLCWFVSIPLMLSYAFPRVSNLITFSKKHSVVLRPPPLVAASRRLFSVAKKSKETNTLENEGSILVIVESPAKARTIQSFFPLTQYVIESCQGHVRDLGKFKKEGSQNDIIVKSLGLGVHDVGIRVHDNFEPIYVISEGKTEILRKLADRLRKASALLLATDEDREGEAIAWHLLEVLKPKVPVRRAVFHEISKVSLEKAFSSPREIDVNLVHAQEARRMLDRLTGFSISPILWRL